ncbi:MAG: hypothetical protein HYR50_05290 [Candidatus Rokubacteria bacterium]|nr:hypothetical protein [Candidatus Rokubacteria bacterium]
MRSFLHLVKGDSPPLANAVIERNLREPGARVTIVLLDGARAPVSAGAAVKRLGLDLDYDALLDLIFDSDHVVTW